jgi:hypothetical protein
VGINWHVGTISNCYATGAVSGGYCVAGGLAGKNGAGATITNCYSAGAVSAEYHAGGLVGSNYSTLTASFWDTETSGQSASDGGTGKTTAEMKTQSTFTDAGWDFADTWEMPTDSYPRLRWQSQVLLHDWNADGIMSIVGDVPPFVQCVYFSNCAGVADSIAVGDCNHDGIVSIIGDVPCFVNCVYFGNCPD